MYKTILHLAIKNALLRKTRAALLIFMIGASMSFMLSLEGLYDGMTKNMIDMNLRSESGEISIYAKEYRLKQDIKYSIKNAAKIKEDLAQIGSINSVVSRFKVSGLIASAKKSYPSDLIGVDFKAEEEFGKISEFIKKGDLNLGKNGCAVGKELAKNLKLRLNSKIIFTTQDANKNIKSKLLRVKAVIQTTNINIDNKAIFIDIDSVRDFVGVDHGSATQISIRSQDKNLEQKLKAQYPKLDVLTFAQINPLLKQMQDMTVVFNTISFSIVMGVVFIGILGVMYVSILERIREFGIMSAVGYSYSNIRLQVILESLFLAILGFLLGSVLSLVSLYYLNSYGLDLKEFADGMQSFGMSSVIYADIKIEYFVRTFYAIVFASIISVFLPLKKIKKLNPVDVIKAES